MYQTQNQARRNQSPMPKMKKSNIDWGAIAAKLPVKKHDIDHIKARQKLWKSMDINNNGFLSLAEVDKGIRDALKIDNFFNTKPVIMRAFEFAKSYCPAKGKNKKYGDDYVEKKEFRVLLVALRQRFEFHEAFKRIDFNNDDRIDF